MAGNVLILGGGVAGWMAAAALSRMPDTRVALVDAGDTGAAIRAVAAGPVLRDFHASLGVGEQDVLAATRGTIRLGTRFVGPGFDYIHAYADFGAALDEVPFHHLWLKLRAAGLAADIGDYNLGVTAARLGRFARPTRDRRATIDYGYHFDARLYADFLRGQAAGVAHHRGQVLGMNLRGDLVESVTLDGDRRLQADLYVDCCRDRGRGDDGEWEAWPELPSAVATSIAEDLPPFTTVMHDTEGLRADIPLQHGDCGNRMLTFSPGRRTRPWRGNRLAIGHAAASLPPLETSEADLVALDVARLAACPDAASYNRAAAAELGQIRDFTALLGRADMPESLQRRIERFRADGRLPEDANPVIRPSSWLAALLGQGIRPRRWDSRADALDEEAAAATLRRYAMLIGHSAQSMPPHAEYLAHHCPAPAASARGGA